MKCAGVGGGSAITDTLTFSRSRDHKLLAGTFIRGKSLEVAQM